MMICMFIIYNQGQKNRLNRPIFRRKIGRFFGEKSDFGGLGKDFAVEKSTEKISAKNRKIPTFFRKNPIFPEKIRFFPKFGTNYILGH